MGFEAITSKQHQIELKFWPQVVLIVVQILFKAFWKTQIFTETGNVHKVSVFGLTFIPIYLLKMAEIKNSHLVIQISKNQSPISFQLSVKNLITFCSIWAVFGYNWVMNPGSKIKRSQLRLAPLFQKLIIIKYSRSSSSLNWGIYLLFFLFWLTQKERFLKRSRRFIYFVFILP